MGVFLQKNLKSIVHTGVSRIFGTQSTAPPPQQIGPAHNIGLCKSVFLEPLTLPRRVTDVSAEFAVACR